MARKTSTILSACALLAGALAASPAAADVFSSQGFSGETTTLDALPGVNLDAAPGSAINGNCVEVEVPAFSYGDRTGLSHTRTECKVGNFSFSTSGSAGQTGIMGMDRTYNYQRPPWAEGWRP
jgi:hypothetical protein